MYVAASLRNVSDEAATFDPCKKYGSYFAADTMLAGTRRFTVSKTVSRSGETVSKNRVPGEFQARLSRR